MLLQHPARRHALAYHAQRVFTRHLGLAVTLAMLVSVHPALLLLAQIYAEGHLVSRARGLYRQVLRLSPDNKTAAEGVAALPEKVAEPKPAGGGLRRLLRIR